MSVQQEAFRVAVTGGTGFVGRTTIAQACALGLPLNALARQPQAACAGVTWVNGALDRNDCLQRPIADAYVVLHIAGVVNDPHKADRKNVLWRKLAPVLLSYRGRRFPQNRKTK